MAKGAPKKSKKDRLETIEAGEMLGPDCPVRALGHMNATYYFADPIGQVRALRANDMTTNNLISLFQSEIGWLEKNCRAQSRRGTSGMDKTTWHNPTAVARLIAACRREGFFDPDVQTRGPGIWPFDAELMIGEEFAGSEQLVIHTGDRVGWITFSGGRMNEIEWEKAGVRLGEFVYPASAPQPGVGDDSATAEDIEDLTAMFNRWKWREGATVTQLLLGHVVCQILLALMPYRPSAWIQAVTGGGKSKLLDFLETLVQGRALRYENATAAGLREDFKGQNEARPVYINEAESTEDNRRLQGLIEMARYVYTAGEGGYRRGGSQGAAHSPTAMFMFAAVDPPPLLPQDANRIVMMRMAPLKVTSAQMEAFEEEMPALARRLAPKLARRAVEIYPMFAGALNTFRKALIAAHHTPRTANTIGVLLAAAHLVQHAAPPDDSDAEEWAKQLDARILASKNDTRSNEGLCLLRLKTHLVKPWKSSEDTPLGHYIRGAVHGGGASSLDTTSDQAAIKRYGVAIVTRKDPETGIKKKWIAVANRHEGIIEVFKGSRWAAGGHIEPLRQLDGAFAPSSPVHFAGSSDRATLLPVRYFPQQEIGQGDTEVEDLDLPAAGDGAAEGAGDA